MPQINATLPKDLINELHSIAKKTKKSFSSLVCEIIKKGLELSRKQNDLETQKKFVREQ